MGCAASTAADAIKPEGACPNALFSTGSGALKCLLWCNKVMAAARWWIFVPSPDMRVHVWHCENATKSQTVGSVVLQREWCLSASASKVSCGAQTIHRPKLSSSHSWDSLPNTVLRRVIGQVYAVAPIGERIGSKPLVEHVLMLLAKKCLVPSAFSPTFRCRACQSEATCRR